MTNIHIQPPSNWGGVTQLTSSNSPLVITAAGTHGSIIRSLIVAADKGRIKVEISSDGDAYGDPMYIEPGDAWVYNTSVQGLGSDVIVDKVRLTHQGTDTHYKVSVSSSLTHYVTGFREVTETSEAYIFEVSGSVWYEAWASPGSSAASAVWKCRKSDGSTSNKITKTWADGNENYDNKADNLSSLTYS